jgi:rubrerythrin
VVLLKKQPETPLFGLPTELVVGAAIAVILGFVAFTLWNWRCPACNRYLGKGISPSFCPKCGVPLQ